MSHQTRIKELTENLKEILPGLKAFSRVVDAIGAVVVVNELEYSRTVADWNAVRDELKRIKAGILTIMGIRDEMRKGGVLKSKKIYGKWIGATLKVEMHLTKTGKWLGKEKDRGWWSLDIEYEESDDSRRGHFRCAYYVGGKKIKDLERACTSLGEIYRLLETLELP